MRVDGGIIAGGQARRMGGIDKGLVEMNGRPLAAWVADVLQPFVQDVWINCNRNIEAYRQITAHICQDKSKEALGPLAGLLALMQTSEADYLLVSPCDTPYLPQEFGHVLLDQLRTQLDKAGSETPPPVAVRAGERYHPLHLCISTNYQNNLEDYLARGLRKVHEWLEALDPVWVDFENEGDCFRNVNRLEDLIG